MISRAAAVAASVLLIAACADDATPDKSASDAASEPVQDQSGAATPATAMATPADLATLAAGEPVAAAIYGQWNVTQARLTDPAARVQAFGDAQLAAMKGLRLAISRHSAAWSGGLLASDPAAYSSFRQVCADPRPRERGNAGGVALSCADGKPFGPPEANGQPTLQLEGDNQLVLRWFDGVTLELRRAS